MFANKVIGKTVFKLKMLEDVHVLRNLRRSVESGKHALIMLTRRGQALMRQVGIMASSIRQDKQMLMTLHLLTNHVLTSTFLTLLRLFKHR